MKKLSPTTKHVLFVFVLPIVLLAGLSAGVASGMHPAAPSNAVAQGASAPAAASAGVQPQQASLDTSLDWNRIEETKSDGGYTYWLEHEGAGQRGR